MRTFFLDLASHHGTLACVTEERVAALASIDHRLSDHDLQPAIERLLEEAGWTYADLTHVACVTGPGGFTSIRSAIACANIVADQLNIPLAGIHLSELYHARMQPAASHLWLHSTKKTHLFARTFGIEESPWNELTLITTEDLKAKSYQLQATSWTGELIPEHQPLVSDLQSASLQPLPDILPAFLAAQKYGKELLVPWYGRGW